MKIVIDTNVVMSGIFFGGAPQKVLQSVLDDKTDAFATVDILQEYEEIADEMVERKQGHIQNRLFNKLMEKLEVIESNTVVDICRDPDDNKFLSCAIDSHALFIVSGDKDLLTLNAHEGVEIITAGEFCKRYPDLVTKKEEIDNLKS